MPLSFASLIFRLCFESLLDLILGLAIAGAESTSEEIAVGLSKYFLWKVVTSFQKCWMVNAGFQVYSSSE